MTPTTAEILRLDGHVIAAKIAAGEVTSEQVTQACLDQIAAVDETVNAFINVDAELALAQARAVDAKIAAGEKLGPLAGVPLALKDVLCFQGMPTTAGSKILEHWESPYNATLTQRLLDADIVIIGKTNMDEFAMGSSTENSAFGVCRNPWQLDHIPGGSGGGSAAALAAFEAPLAIGTDTGGSIRQPAGMTGTIGVKPTYGGTSRYGQIALASSLDQPGPCARSVLDAALLHEIIAGHDPLDSTSIDQPVPPVVEAARNADITGMKIGVVTQLGGEGYAPGVKAKFAETVALLESLGAEIVEVSCPHFEYATAAYYLIQPAETSSNLARFDAMRYGLRVGDDGEHSAEEVMSLSRGAGLGIEAKRRIIIGTYALSTGYYDAYYGSAQKIRTLIKNDFEAAFAQAEVLISPTTPTTAFPIGERINDPLAMYMNDLCTIPSNLAGIAGASFPVGLSADNQMPVGFHVMAPVLADDRLYRVGAALEQALGRLCDQIPDLPNTLTPQGAAAETQEDAR